MIDVAKRHQMNIAKKTLQLSDAGARILGGMSKEEAREVLRKAGWSERRIENAEK